MGDQKQPPASDAGGGSGGGGSGSGQTPPAGRSRRFSRRVPVNRIGIFLIELIYLAILAVIAWAFLTEQNYWWLERIPKTIVSVPVGVLWFGALGGVLISLTGVHEHRYTWDPEYWSWHLIRPFVGAAVALIGVMIIQAGILATGRPDQATNIATDNTFYYLVAFVAGYREATFRGMIKRLSDVILTSEGGGAAPAIAAVDPEKGPAGLTVKIRGSNLSSVESVTFGTEPAPRVHVASGTLLEVEAPAGTTGEAVDVTVSSSTGSSTLSKAFTFE